MPRLNVFWAQLKPYKLLLCNNIDKQEKEYAPSRDSVTGSSSKAITTVIIEGEFRGHMENHIEEVRDQTEPDA
ncbi:hypothetical protein CVT26_012677 [Gymnopilus dilepis]|uniref:Uncharacterized protein n=1 Tax=Gymnopilus dilepis TaxID=231916 RepID=A0A409WAS1_9AGAR|nr:hypothetical protein CVT26_012677 [Gymnopilus dilepis]